MIDGREKEAVLIGIQRIKRDDGVIIDAYDIVAFPNPDNKLEIVKGIITKVEIKTQYNLGTSKMSHYGRVTVKRPNELMQYVVSVNDVIPTESKFNGISEGKASLSLYNNDEFLERMLNEVKVVGGD